MPHVAVVFDPDPELGPDPFDRSAKTARRIGDFIPAGSDLLLIWREWGEQFEGGSRTHVVGDGAWENVTEGQLRETLGLIDDLPEVSE